MSDRNSVRIQPSATAKEARDHALRAARENDAGWNPTSRQATGWHGLLGFVSNYRSGEDPSYSPGHSYTHTEKIWDGRTGNCDLNNTKAEALIVPGATSTRPIDSGGIYQAKARMGPFAPSGDVVTTQTGRHSVRNTTIPGRHAFASTVDRSFTQAPDGSIYAATTGNGRHPSIVLDVVNRLLGPEVFQSQNHIGARAVLAPSVQPSQRPR